MGNPAWRFEGILTKYDCHLMVGLVSLVLGGFNG